MADSGRESKQNSVSDLAEHKAEFSWCVLILLRLC